MRTALTLVIALVGLLATIEQSFAQRLQVIGHDLYAGPICAGPLGPAPCHAIERYLRMRQQAAQLPALPVIGFWPGIGPICLGPLGPGPCASVREYILIQEFSSELGLPIIDHQSSMGPICAGPLGPGPCAAIQQYLMNQRAGGVINRPFNPRDVRVLDTPRDIGPVCSGPWGPAPCNLVQQYLLDETTGNAPTTSPLGTSADQNAKDVAQQCAQRAGFDVTAFSSCMGQRIVLPPSKQTILDCAVSSVDTRRFAECAAPSFGIQLSDDQRIVSSCAMLSSGDSTFQSRPMQRIA